MTIAASGAVSLADFRTEFVGGSAAISMDDLYRGGSNIRSLAANNTATNLAASVPTSGVIAFDDFYGTAKGFRKTYTATATNQDASAVFGDDYGVDYPKEIVINSGVELGATSTSQEALQIDSGLSGGLTITNNGTLSGAGGAAGSDGGDAFQADVACTLINNGTIRAGGGGGGAGGSGGTGGTGGQGSFSTSGWGSYTHVGAGSGGIGQTGVTAFSTGNTYYWYWGNSYLGSTVGYAANTLTSGGILHQHSYPTNYGSGYNAGAGASWWRYAIRRYTTTTSYSNGGSGGSGGSGGAGAVGQGYNQSAGSGSSGSGGSSGSAGGTNAGAGGTGGTGGTGGNGGSYGNSGGNGATGSTGATGANGNHSNGSAGSGGSGGSSGGAAGKYIRGLSNVTFTNNGTVQGGTA